MIFTFEEARKTSGRFYEFQYATVIKRSEKSQHFGCFKGNDKEMFIHVSKVYTTDKKCFDHLIEDWNSKCTGTCDMYQYWIVGQVVKESFTAEQVRQRMFDENRNHLPVLVQNGSFDVIQ
jgi:hypothetical protein